MRSLVLLGIAAATALAVIPSPQAAEGPDVPLKETVGHFIFFDRNLSQPKGQSCASCHDFNTAFSDPRGRATSEGVVKGLFGPRNAPSLMYNALTPPLITAGDGGITALGGQFRDGRADFIEDQAKLPFLNPIEMANPDIATVVGKVRDARYAADFKAVYGDAIFDDDQAAFDAIADALGAYQRGKFLMPFGSKFDAYQRGEAVLTDAEARGLELFVAADKGNCARCHSHNSSNRNGRKSIFSDYRYSNVGVPRNPANKFYDMPPQFNPDGREYIDIGLRDHLTHDSTRGQFKTPTLRNVARTAPYMHNGYFKTLKGLVDFFNTRDVRPTCARPFTSEADAQQLGCWPAPEVPETINTTDMGHLGLSDQEVDDIVAFLGTLSDGWSPPADGTRK
jgi:cytochrome c peroxidase